MYIYSMYCTKRSFLDDPWPSEIRSPWPAPCPQPWPIWTWIWGQGGQIFHHHGTCSDKKKGHQPTCLWFGVSLTVVVADQPTPTWTNARRGRNAAACVASVAAARPSRHRRRSGGRDRPCGWDRPNQMSWEKMAKGGEKPVATCWFWEHCGW